MKVSGYVTYPILGAILAGAAGLYVYLAGQHATAGHERHDKQFESIDNKVDKQMDRMEHKLDYFMERSGMGFSDKAPKLIDGHEDP